IRWLAGRPIWRDDSVHVMTVGFRPHRRRTKPINQRLRYDRTYWSRLGLPQPQRLLPILGVGPNGGPQDLSSSGSNGSLGTSPAVYRPTPYGIALFCVGGTYFEVPMPAIAANQDFYFSIRFLPVS